MRKVHAPDPRGDGESDAEQLMSSEREGQAIPERGSPVRRRGSLSANSPSYAAFLSYSHAADGKLAPRLQSALQRFAKPWYQRRALRIFRDKTSLSATPSLWPTIEQALAASSHFVLLASPEAARSRWVQQEVAWWLKHRSPETFLIVLADGTVAWDNSLEDFDRQVTDALPSNLNAAFSAEPLWVDLRWAKQDIQLSRDDAGFQDAVADLAAVLHGRPKDDLVGEDMRQHRRAIRLARGVISALALLVLAFAGATGVAWNQRDEAIKQKDEAVRQQKIAISRQLAAQARNLLNDRLDLALLLSAQAYSTADTVEARGSLLSAIDLGPLPSTFLHGHTDTVYSLAFSPDGTTLASASADGTIRLWDVATRRSLGQPLAGHTDKVLSVAFSPDSTTLASASADGTLRLWDLATRRLLGQPLAGHTDTVPGVAFSPDGTTLASASGDHTVRLWNVTTHKPLGQPLTGHTDTVRSVAFSPDGATLASAGNDGTIRLWDVVTRQALGQPLVSQSLIVLSIAFSPDGTTLAAATSDRGIELWDVTAGQWGEPISGHDNSVWSVAFSPDGATLASGSADRTIGLWDVATRQPRGEPISGHNSTVWSVAFSPDGTILASASDDSTVRLWDVATREPLGQPLTGHTGGVVLSVAFSPDGTTLAAGSYDRTIRLWDVATHQLLGQLLTGHTDFSDFARSLAFSPDGKTLASGSFDSTVRLWDVATRQPLGSPLTGHTDSVESVAFTPDGTTLASASSDDTIRLWNLRVDTWVERACRVANRNLTQAEWTQVMGLDAPYERTCSGLPSGT